MKRKIQMMFLLIVVLATSIMMGGCSNSASTEEEVARIEQQNQELKEEAKQLQEKNQELEEEIERLDPKPAPELVEEEAEKETASTFNIYGADSNTYEKELLEEITIADNLELEKKIELLADKLSEKQFEGLGIKLHKIENEDGKKIATINLVEESGENDSSWNGTYFQGSTGGTVTTVALDETFLQKEYKGDWIDGIKFLYEGEKIVFDHVQPLSEISYR